MANSKNNKKGKGAQTKKTQNVTRTRSQEARETAEKTKAAKIAKARAEGRKKKAEYLQEAERRKAEGERNAKGQVEASLDKSKNNDKKEVKQAALAMLGLKRNSSPVISTPDGESSISLESDVIEKKEVQNPQNTPLSPDKKMPSSRASKVQLPLLEPTPPLAHTSEREESAG